MYAFTSPRVGREKFEITCVVAVVVTVDTTVEFVVGEVVEVVTVDS
jgi:hypothetical protein